MEVSLILVAVFSVLVLISHGIGHKRGLVDGYISAMRIYGEEQSFYEDNLISYSDADGYLNLNGESVHISEFLIPKE